MVGSLLAVLWLPYLLTLGPLSPTPKSGDLYSWRLEKNNWVTFSWVSWEDARRFCEKLAAATGRPIRLPTEAEWEYAYRAGATTDDA
jgi:hypothetical protein